MGFDVKKILGSAIKLEIYWLDECFIGLINFIIANNIVILGGAYIVMS